MNMTPNNFSQYFVGLDQNKSLATSRELYSVPHQDSSTRDIEYIRSSPTRTGADEPHDANYKAREGADHHHNPTKYRGFSPKRRGKSNISDKPGPDSYIDGRRNLLTGGENPEDEREFYPKSGVPRKDREFDRKMGHLMGEPRGSHPAGREVDSRQVQPSKHLARGAVFERSKNSKLRSFVAGVWPDDDEDKPKFNPLDRIASTGRKDWFLRRTVQSPQSSVDDDIQGLGIRPKRRILAAKDDRDGFKSFSGSSSV